MLPAMTIAKKAMANAKRAVINVGDGRGFIVSAGESRYIITAAHCLPDSRFPKPHLANSIDELTFPNLLGRFGSKRQTVWAELCARNICDDIAVFSEPDGQELHEKYQRYEKFTATTMTLGNPPAIVESYKWSETPGTAAWVLSLDGEWQSCTLHNGGRFLSIEQNNLIESGMSGSPIIDSNGNAIGLISTSGGGEHGHNMNPNLLDCLPQWLLRKLDVVA
jgi:hypothetical protein